MRMILLLSLFLAGSVRAQIAPVFDITKKFAPDAVVAPYTDPRLILTRPPIKTWQKGTIEQTDFFIMDDGSAQFGAKDTAPKDETMRLTSSLLWHAQVNFDRINDMQIVLLNNGDLTVSLTSNDLIFIHVGRDRFPGREITLRIDSSKPVSTNSDFFNPISHPDLLAQLIKGRSVLTRYYDWPVDSPVDKESTLAGLKVGVEYAKWVLAGQPARAGVKTETKESQVGEESTTDSTSAVTSTPTGDPSNLVKLVQFSLSLRGGFSGPVSGVDSDDLRKAIVAYESDSKLPVIGKPTKALLVHLVVNMPDQGE